MIKIGILFVGPLPIEHRLIRELEQQHISVSRIDAITPLPKIQVGDADLIAIGLIEKENLLEKIDFGLLDMLTTPQPESTREPFSSAKFPRNKAKLIKPKDIARKLPFKKR